MGARPSGKALKNQNRKKAEASYQCPFENDQAEAFKPWLTRTGVKHKRDHCRQQKQQNEPAKKQHETF